MLKSPLAKLEPKFPPIFFPTEPKDEPTLFPSSRPRDPTAERPADFTGEDFDDFPDAALEVCPEGFGELEAEAAFFSAFFRMRNSSVFVMGLLTAGFSSA